MSHGLDFPTENLERIKAVSKLAKAYKAQVINYLAASKKKVGLLINFGESSLKWERISDF